MSKPRFLPSLLLIPVIIAIGAQVALAQFQDVKEGNSYYLSINYLQEHGIIEGYEDNTFKPNQNVNRAEALKIITLATGVLTSAEIESSIPDPSTQEAPFSDTPFSEWYTKYLEAAKIRGIISGYEDNSFKPEQNINLAETLKILFQSYGDFDLESTGKNLYNDTPADAWFSKYTSYAGAKGIINVYNTNTVSSDQEMTRGYLAEVIYRTILSREGYEFGLATWYGAAVQGSNTASGETFDKDALTAAHKYLPFGTIVEVGNLANGKSIQVKITDRGPYGPGRVLDLSSGAFSQIASLGAGVIKVQYRSVSLP